jgi:hypothetical protein
MFTEAWKANVDIVAALEERVKAMLAPTNLIRAELAGSDTATALGVVANSSSPVLALCRKLLEAGHDHATPLEAWRGDTLCLHIRSIGEAAELRVNPKGTGFVKGPNGVPTAPPMRGNGHGGWSITFELDGLRFTATVSRFPDGRVAELFLNNHKAGNQSDTNARDAAILLSFALQHGADINVIRKALCRDSQDRALGPVAAALDLIAETKP